ncbi:MAG TPA: hypothetical protein VK453_28435 [Micromonosporaceae bacterium]|nr:hypothetical protein [Micromonosporaceae bacterium]
MSQQVRRPPDRSAATDGRRRFAAVLCCGLLLAGACRSAGPDRPPDETEVTPSWQELALAAPAGPPGRLVLRDAVACGGRWYAVGGVATDAGETRPAAWTSTDGRQWTALTFSAHSYYGPQNVLYSAACRDGRLATVGARSGGAHANPRVSTWWQRDDTTLVEARAPFERFGGPQAVNVARVAAGPAGWIIAGNRMSGAATWISTDAVSFDLVERAPELASDDGGDTWAFDAVASATGWLIVGGLIRPGHSDRDPALWTSVDGRRWTRDALPATAEYDEMQRVARVDGALVAVGPRGTTFGAWRDDGTGWAAAGRFGQLAGGIPAVPGLTAANGTVVAAVTNGAVHTLWRSADAGRSWRPVAGPVAMPAGAERAVATAADGTTLLLVVDDGASARIWRADNW